MTDYYQDACIKGKLDKIKVPVLALNALDDPFSPGESLPLDEAEKSDHVAILTTAYGGHIGFMEGAFPFKLHFSDRLFAQFVKGIIENHDAIIN